jgi:hypothetical protein
MKHPHLKITVRLSGRDMNALIKRAQLQGKSVTRVATELLGRRLERLQKQDGAFPRDTIDVAAHAQVLEEPAL